METQLVKKLKLTGGRFRNGSLYISSLWDEQKFVALDVRYIVEQEDTKIPTKTGFRIPKASIPDFLSILGREKPEDESIEIYKLPKRSLFITFSDHPKYGEGTDIRYYSDSEKYTGWEKSGIRFNAKDYQLLAKLFDNLEKPKFHYEPRARISFRSSDKESTPKSHNENMRSGIAQELEDLIG